MQNSLRVRTRAQKRIATGMRQPFHKLPSNVWQTHVYPHLGARNLASLSRASKERRGNARNQMSRMLESTRLKDRAVEAAATKLMFALTHGMATWDKRRTDPDADMPLSKAVDLSATIPTLSYWFDWWNPAFPGSGACNVFMLWGPVVRDLIGLEIPRAGLKLRFPKVRIAGRKLRIKWAPTEMFDHGRIRKPERPFDKAMQSLALRILGRAVKMYNQHPVISG